MARRFRGTTVREGMLLRGPAGWGEFAPFPEYAASQCSRWLAAAIEAAYVGWPDPVRSHIPVNAIIPAVSADDAAALTRTAVIERGCTTIKVKVAELGQNLADDEGRVAAVRDVLDVTLGRGVGQIRLDANGAWSVDSAVTALTRLAPYDLQYVEQPCADLTDLVAVRQRASVLVAADESVRLADDPQAAAALVDVVIVKVPPLGGVRPALQVAEAAHAVDTPVVVSGALDSCVGLSAGLALAAALPDLPYACGLGTGALLAADLAPEPVVPIAGQLAVTRHAPDLDALLAARERITPERAAWWRDRLAAAWEAMAA
jgi:O-succinylbenzoate synthase